ncbi:MAG TPA: DUF6717 family protein [Aquella sp.]|nr:DUF6717 family protein [Aquella sp.]
MYNNSVMVLYPYSARGYDDWVFDAPEVGLYREAFIAGSDLLITKATQHIPNAKQGIKLTFSGDEFPNYDVKLEWLRPEASGNTYYCGKYKMNCWLCPALLLFFKNPPEFIYAKFDTIPEGQELPSKNPPKNPYQYIDWINEHFNSRSN